MKQQQTVRTETATADAVRGRATGVLFFTGFGAMWMFAGLKQIHHASWLALLALAAACAVLLLLTTLLMRRARHLPAGTMSREHETKVQRMFNAVNIIQWVSVGTAIVILNVLRLPMYIVPAVSVIVGLHLFPLAAAFRYRQHYVTGSLLVLWPLACLVVLPDERISGVCAVGVSAVLLLSAAATLFRTSASLRTPSTAAIAA